MNEFKRKKITLYTYFYTVVGYLCLSTALQVWLHYKHNRFYGYNTISKTCYHAEHMHAVS